MNTDTADRCPEYPRYPDWKQIAKEANRTVRLAGTTEPWVSFACKVYEATGQSAALLVPALRGTWLISAPNADSEGGGMIANVGGNDWRIYTIHPDDCRALCALEVKP